MLARSFHRIPQLRWQIAVTRCCSEHRTATKALQQVLHQSWGAASRRCDSTCTVWSAEKKAESRESVRCPASGKRGRHGDCRQRPIKPRRCVWGPVDFPHKAAPLGGNVTDRVMRTSEGHDGDRVQSPDPPVIPSHMDHSRHFGRTGHRAREPRPAHHAGDPGPFPPAVSC